MIAEAKRQQVRPFLATIPQWCRAARGPVASGSWIR